MLKSCVGALLAFVVSPSNGLSSILHLKLKHGLRAGTSLFAYGLKVLEDVANREAVRRHAEVRHKASENSLPRMRCFPYVWLQPQAFSS